MSFTQSLAAISVDKRIAIGPCVRNSAGVYGPFCAFNDGEIVSAFAELATTQDNAVLSVPEMADELRANGFDTLVFQTFSDVAELTGGLPDPDPLVAKLRAIYANLNTRDPIIIAHAPHAGCVGVVN